MFNIGFWEIVVIGVIALLVLGPDQLPSLARMVGKFTGELKRATDDFKSEFASTTKETRQVVDELKTSVQNSINESVQPLQEALRHHEYHDDGGLPVPNPHAVATGDQPEKVLIDEETQKIDIASPKKVDPS